MHLSNVVKYDRLGACLEALPLLAFQRILYYLTASVIDQERGEARAATLRRNLLLTSKTIKEKVEENNTPFIEQILRCRHRLTNSMALFLEEAPSMQVIIDRHLKRYKLDEIYQAMQRIKGIFREILGKREMQMQRDTRYFSSIGTHHMVNYRFLGGISLYVSSVPLHNEPAQLCFEIKVVSPIGTIEIEGSPLCSPQRFRRIAFRMIRCLGATFQGFSCGIEREGRLDGCIELSSAQQFTFEGQSSAEDLTSISCIDALKKKIGVSELILPRVKDPYKLRVKLLQTVYKVNRVDEIVLPCPLYGIREGEWPNPCSPWRGVVDRWSGLLFHRILEKKKLVVRRFFEVENISCLERGYVSLRSDI